MARAYPQSLPSAYVDDHLDEVLAWNRGDFGFWMRAFWPRVFRGIPVSACFGFASNGSPDEDTGTSPAHAPFGEITAFGIPAGPWDFPKPNWSTDALNTWLALHAGAIVRALLRRAACMEVDCWRPAHGGLADATAVGIAMLAGELESVCRGLDARLVPTRPTLWVPAITFWAWSAGSGRARAQLNAMAGTLATLPEARRFWEGGHLLAKAVYAGTLRGDGTTYENVGYAWLRTAQKLWMAAVHAERCGTYEDRAFFLRAMGDPRVIAWTEQVLALAASGYSPSRYAPPPPTPALDWKLPLITTCAVGSIGFNVWRATQ